MNVEEALERMKEKGYKHTTKRQEILELFARDSRYISAKEVLDYMQSRYSGLSFDTVYRNLSIFSDIDILEMTELEGEKRFRLSCATPHHHHHMICMSCGRTKHVHACPMDTLDPVKEEFEITDHKFEIYGYCQECKTTPVN
ncbi:Fur family transcriptional regulator [Salsuginibacillus kocurii]|uniref:Fur family transcriptional regulator n=1 Tax=Salsuginibacillus kocurii TaxID=427078 RepID=UPI00035F6B7E|nr:Fur family transcriptional regulator [Salsuginibacillus kocurii]